MEDIGMHPDHRSGQPEWEVREQWWVNSDAFCPFCAALFKEMLETEYPFLTTEHPNDIVAERYEFTCECGRRVYVNPIIKMELMVKVVG